MRRRAGSTGSRGIPPPYTFHQLRRLPQFPGSWRRMSQQPMPRKKKLPDDAVAKMIRFTAVKPMDRQKKILDNLMKNNKKYKDDPYAKEFGINVSGEMATLQGRVLDAPFIEYAGGKAASINKANQGK